MENLLDLDDEQFLEALKSFHHSGDHHAHNLTILSERMASQPSARCVQMASVILESALSSALMNVSDPSLWQQCSAFLDGCHHILNDTINAGLALSLVGLMGSAIRLLQSQRCEAEWWDPVSVQRWLEGVLNQLTSFLS